MRLNSREELQRFREEARSKLDEQQRAKTQIFVGMGTCGIAAGGRAVMDAILEELENRKIDARVIQTGCIGMCEKEPLVDVQRPGEPRITYGKVKPADARRIVCSHVLHGRVVEDLVVARFETV